MLGSSLRDGAPWQIESDVQDFESVLSVSEKAKSDSLSPAVKGDFRRGWARDSLDGNTKEAMSSGGISVLILLSGKACIRGVRLSSLPEKASVLRT